MDRIFKHIELSLQQADSICDVDDLLFSMETRLGRELGERTAEWESVVAIAERVACRVTHRKRPRVISAIEPEGSSNGRED